MLVAVEMCNGQGGDAVECVMRWMGAAARESLVEEVGSWFLVRPWSERERQRESERERDAFNAADASADLENLGGSTTYTVV